MDLIAIGNGGAVDPFRYVYTPLPETEAEATDSIYVCEFNGAASANETGVGLGLTGSDLVLTQSGGVGVADGIRRITRNARMGFKATDAFYNAMIDGAEGFSLMFGLRNVYGATASFDSWLSFFGSSFGMMANFASSSGAFSWNHTAGGKGNGVSVNSFVTDGDDIYVVHSIEYASGIHFVGLARTLPQSLNDFGSQDLLLIGAHSCGPYAYSSGQSEALLGIISYSGTGYTTQFDIASLTAANFPCVTVR